MKIKIIKTPGMVLINILETINHTKDYKIVKIILNSLKFIVNIF